jgi:hypothetical protein
MVAHCQVTPMSAFGHRAHPQRIWGSQSQADML